MDSMLNFNDIVIYSGREIQDIYNEATIDIFMSESSYFKDIINKRNSGVLTESVLLEAEESRIKKILNTIKDFFKNLWGKIKEFIKKIKDKITGASKKQAIEAMEIKIKETYKGLPKEFGSYSNYTDIEKAIKDAKIFLFPDAISKSLEDMLDIKIKRYDDICNKYNDIVKNLQSTINSLDNKQPFRDSNNVGEFTEKLHQFSNDLGELIEDALNNTKQFEGTKYKMADEHKYVRVVGEDKINNPYMNYLKIIENNPNSMETFHQYNTPDKYISQLEYIKKEYNKCAEKIDDKKYGYGSINRLESNLMDLSNSTNIIIARRTDGQEIQGLTKLSQFINDSLKLTNNFSSEILRNVSNNAAAKMYLCNHNIREINRGINLVRQYVKGYANEI